MDDSMSRLEALVCGRCGGAWQSDWKYCPHCGDTGAARVGRKWADRHTIVELGLAVGVVAALLMGRNSGLQTQQWAAASAPAASTSTFYTEVPADHWRDTGVNVPAGATVTLQASGSWTPYKGNTPEVGPEGVAGSRSDDVMCKGADWGALVGRIGDEPYFKVGRETTFHSNGGGKLILGMNDDFNSRATGDNVGSMQVTITMSGTIGVPAPGASIDFPKK